MNVTSIDAHRARSERVAEAGVEAIHFDLADPVAAMDGHTRGLLARRRAERRSWLVPRSLILADILGLTIAYLIVTLAWGGRGAFGSLQELLVFALTLPCWVVVAKLHGLYSRDHIRAAHATTDDVASVFSIVAIGLWLLVIASHLAGRGGPDLDGLIAFWALAVCIVPTLRRVAREACKRTRAYEQNTLIVGAGDVGQLIARKLVSHPEYGANVVGFVDRRPKARRADLPESLTILGPPERLPAIVDALDVERVIVAFSNESVAQTLATVRQLRDRPVQIDIVPRLFEAVDLDGTVHWVEGVPLLGLRTAPAASTALAIKRAMDIAGAIVGLVALAPLLAYIALRIRLDSPGPILFRQTRVGLDTEEFTMLKFRTMKVDTDEAAHRAYIAETMAATAASGENGLYKLDRSDAITKVGAWLRRTSLDELPQLVNVLRGEMSLVGPRPCIPYEVEHFDPHHLQRFSVLPGLTGLWQVTARANSTYGEALDMDVAYARSWSLGLDVRLLLRTPLQVLTQRDSTA
jgi:exopolysaccharide biosynthesis polyprenyl glycosylphosphotransferase